MAIEVLASYDNNGILNANTLKTNIEKHDGWSAELGDGEGGFPVTVIVDGYTFEVESDGTITDIDVGKEPNPPVGGDDNPTVVDGVTIPKGYTVSEKENENEVEEGLVIRDGNGNEYVWIEVPKTDVVYQKAGTDVTDFESNYEKIYDDLKAYGSAYDTTGESGEDEWYAWKDENGDGEFTSDELYAENEDKTARLDTEIKELNTGCGLTYDQYYALKKEMLKSIYENEGFWIGRYEAGIASPRTSEGEATAKALSQQDKYPYNFVTCSQAQSLASNIKASESDVTSSLMFGVQWNLVCKFLETNSTLNPSDINSDSSSWGNYSNATFKINSGEFSEDDGSTWKKFNSNEGTNVKSQVKQSGQEILLTTGASAKNIDGTTPEGRDRNCVLNIYDFAGNEFEWTLEKTPNSRFSCSIRGGNYGYDGDSEPASNHDVESPVGSFIQISFRVSLY